ncbi:translation initiation factor eIF-2B epsilon subunit, GEF [Dimargaris cristalligena]|nr:translation initiation factor eIF-2B epsilon subunit, GEF [Dimargaris cristalligena]
MPPKKPKQQNIEAEEKLSVVMIADSFDQQMMPLTQTTPRCLLPLCNVPLIEYTFELLAIAGIEEIFIFCCIHAQKVKDYIAQSKWSKSHSPFEVRIIVTQEAMSVGDVLRELDGKSLIRNDFILIYGDVVSNMNLAKALEAHKARRAIDKNAIMTMVVKETSPNHRTRGHQEAVYVIDDSTQQCIHYHAPRRGTDSYRTVPLSVEFFEKHPQLQLRYDLMDCQIDICSVEVPALFTENFDYQDLRRDFVTGILGSEVLDSTFYIYPIADQHAYAARVQGGQLYDAVSRDVMARWTFPLVPESNLQEGDAYVHKRDHVYQEPGVKLARTSNLERNVVIGRGSSVGDHSIISNSVIGRDCQIGDHVTIQGAYLLDGTTVAAHCTVERSILGHQTTVHSHSQIGKGCIVGDGVVVGPRIRVPDHTRLTTKAAAAAAADSDWNDSDAEDNTVVDSSRWGAESNAVIWVPSDEDDDDAEAIYQSQVNALAADLGQIRMDDQDIDDSASEASLDSLEDMDDVGGSGDEYDHFGSEVADTIDRAFSEGHAIADTLLELKGLRFANNKNNHDIRIIILPKILDQVDLSHLMPSLAAAFQRWGELIASVVNSDQDQADTLSIVKDFCLVDRARVDLFLPCVKRLYDADIVEEDMLLQWHQAAVAEKLTGGELLLHQKLQPLINWLLEAEEEDDDSEDEDSD